MANHDESLPSPPFRKSATFLPVDIFVDKKFRLVFSSLPLPSAVLIPSLARINF